MGRSIQIECINAITTFAHQCAGRRYGRYWHKVLCVLCHLLFLSVFAPQDPRHHFKRIT
jgi:hypothetical protein